MRSRHRKQGEGRQAAAEHPPMPAMDSLTRFERASRADERPKYAKTRGRVRHRVRDTSVRTEHLCRCVKRIPRERLRLEFSDKLATDQTLEKLDFRVCRRLTRRITADTRILAISQSDSAPNMLTPFHADLADYALRNKVKHNFCIGHRSRSCRHYCSFWHELCRPALNSRSMTR